METSPRLGRQRALPSLHSSAADREPWLHVFTAAALEAVPVPSPDSRSTMFVGAVERATGPCTSPFARRGQALGSLSAPNPFSGCGRIFNDIVFVYLPSLLPLPFLYLRSISKDTGIGILVFCTLR